MSGWTDQDKAAIDEMAAWAEQMERANSLGARLRRLRTRAGWSLEQLATQTGERLGRKVHFTTLSKIEKSQRNPSPDLLDAVAKALGTSVEALTGEYTPYINEYQYGILSENDIDNREIALKSPKAFLFAPDFHNSSQQFGLSLAEHPIQALLRDESFALIDPTDLELQDGKIYAIRGGAGSLSFKRFRALPPQLESVSGDPSDPPTLIGREPFTVLGRVVWVCSQME